ncbi:TraR/DksA family transcriptional regulator [Roseovarius nanhaiticus]|uniref:Transcriptional regulator, TraR/DksA family n=1 Tax=Roseovarius nanhaiticus TaxID=573024 RepID=A0A1N7GXL0_9RHOB|nr:TraR/DksA family transcriptional regulator [Roseovarius nanhaiticus]SEL20552.1 transcriptional regulator, TraR/DksA family [Roseovarius nanhaiticus]SIS17314.1 transcriptional regulator, TraR/DksA family [Roseovarius nanhaiticus]
MDIAMRKAALQARRTELTQHLEEVEHTLDETPTKDWEDRSSERQGDEVLEALGQAELAEVRRIDAALARISAGTYGICQTCGDDISRARLDLLPATPFCKTCAT